MLTRSPKSGTPWRLSSSLLWSRCPALREIINGFWDEGGGGLELSIDACDEVLASLCRYMHSSILALPIGLQRQLELLRVASELGMLSLYHAAGEALQQKLTLDSVHEVIAFCAEHEFSDLERLSRTFLSSGGKRATVIRYQTGESNPQNAYLRDAIFASLQDVNSVLNQTSTSKAGTAAALSFPDRSVGLTSAQSESRPNTFLPAQLSSPAKKYADVPSSALYGQQSYQDDAPYEFSEFEVDSYVDAASLSLLDIAAAGTLSRTNSHSQAAFENDYSADFPSDFQMDFSDRNVINAAPPSFTLDPSVAHAQPGNPQHSGVGGKAGKPRGGSGGIYGLLLQSSEPVAQEYTRPSGRPGQPAQHANKVPGKVMGERNSRASSGPPSRVKPAAVPAVPAKAAPGQKGTSKTVGAGTAAGIGGGKVNSAEATPRTQRASSLLASARPSSFVEEDRFNYHNNGDDEYIDELSAEDCDFEGDSSFFAEQEKGSEGPQEFSGTMSLAPTREKTVVEKR